MKVINKIGLLVVVLVFASVQVFGALTSAYQISAEDKIKERYTDLSLPFGNIWSSAKVEEFNGSEKEIKKLIKHNDVNAMFLYGYALITGTNPASTIDKDLGVQYLRMADENNSTDAKYWLFRFYYEGKIKQNIAISEANANLEELISLKHVNATMDKATLILNGYLGFDKNYREGVKLLRNITYNSDIAKIEFAQAQLQGENLFQENKTDIVSAFSTLTNLYQNDIINAWRNKFIYFGNFRFAKTKQPTLLPDINTNINYKNEYQVKTLISQLKQNSYYLSDKLVNQFTYELLDNLDVISTTIDANYEMSCYKDALNSSSPSYASKFVSKFPNSNYLQEVKQYLNSLDGKFINECNSKSCYKSYLEYFSNGKNREYALTRIKYYEDQEYQSELAKKQAAIAAEKQKQAEIAYQKEQERLAQIERDKAAEQARLKRQKIIDQYGADYVVDKSCYEANGWFWGNYERCNLSFADGTTGNLIYVDGHYGFEGGLTKTDKILYETLEDAAKDAYRLAKGKSRSNNGRYYPESSSYSSSKSSSSSDYSIISKSADNYVNVEYIGGSYYDIKINTGFNCISKNLKIVISDKYGNIVKTIDRNESDGFSTDNYGYDHPIRIDISCKIECGLSSDKYINTSVKLNKSGFNITIGSNK